jgi:hypothetical protein
VYGKNVRWVYLDWERRFKDVYNQSAGFGKTVRIADSNISIIEQHGKRMGDSFTELFDHHVDRISNGADRNNN